MDKDRVSINQLAVLLLLIITGGKFLALPAIIAGDVGHDSWLVFVASFAWDFVALCFVLWAVKLNIHKRLSLDDILSATLTKWTSKVVHLIFFVVFVSRTVVLLNSCYKMFAVTFDVNTNWIAFILPIIAVSFFVVKVGFNSIARLGQLIVVVVTVSVIALLGFAFAKAELGQLLPVAEVGLPKIFSTSFERSFWFSDYLFIYFAMEHVTPNAKGRVFAPILVTFAVGAVLTVVLDMIFVTLYGSIAPDTEIAMSQIGIFSVTKMTSGRWDWLTLSIWITSVFVKIIVFIWCAYCCVERITGKTFVKLNIPTVIAISLLLTLPLVVTMDGFLDYFVANCIVPFAVVQYALPLALPVLTQRAIIRSNNE